MVDFLSQRKGRKARSSNLITSPSRYDKLLKEGPVPSNLVRVHPSFRVIAIGVPVPPFPGNPVDPPLRSRFQSARVDPAPPEVLLKVITTHHAPSVDKRKVMRLLSFAESLRRLGSDSATSAGIERRAIAFHHLPYCGEGGIISLSVCFERFPLLTPSAVLSRMYPWEEAIQNDDARLLVENVVAGIKRQEEKDDGGDAVRQYFVSGASMREGDEQVLLQFVEKGDYKNASVKVKGGSANVLFPLPMIVEGSYHHALLSDMLQSHAVGRDICLIGGKGMLTVLSTHESILIELFFNKR